MGIPYRKVYRMREQKDAHWTVVMGLTPLPGFEGLWMWQASRAHPERRMRGQVFQGEGDSIVVVGEEERYRFEPLTLEAWEDMREDIHDFDKMRGMVRTNEALQDWYWDEFAHDGDGNEISQSEVLRRLSVGVVG